MFRCGEDDKPVLRELSLKQREMLMAYRNDSIIRLSSPVRVRPERIMIPPQRPNTPTDTGKLAVIAEEPESPTRKRFDVDG